MVTYQRIYTQEVIDTWYISKLNSIEVLLSEGMVVGPNML